MNFGKKNNENQHLKAARQCSMEQRHETVLTELEKIQELDQLSPVDQCEFFILKSKALNKLNQYHEALDLAEKGLTLAMKGNSTLMLVESLTAKGTAEFRLGKNDECFESIQQIKKVILSDIESSQQERDLLYNHFYYLSSLYHYQHLHKDKLLESNQKRLEICEKYGLKYELGEVYHNLGVAYYLKGELLKSIRYYKKSIELSKLTKNFNQLAYCLGNTGKIYSTLGELDIALDYYQQSLDILKKIKNEYLLGAFSNAIGEIYMQKGNLPKSMEYFQNGYQLVKKLGNNLNIAGAYFKIVENFTLQKDYEAAEMYFKELEQIAKTDDNRRIKLIYDFAHALFLKSKGGSRNIVRAGDILRNLMKIEDLQNDPPLHLKYCELLFEELAKSNEEYILDEIKILLEKLESIANSCNSQELKAEIKLLQAKFDLITFNFDRAQKNFIKGQRIACKYDLVRLERKISHEYDKFLQYYDKWTDFQNHQSEISDRLKFASIDDILQLTLKTKEIDSFENSIETSKLLEIVSDNDDSNLKFYSTIDDAKEINLDIQSIREKFESNSVDRIKFDNNTVIMNRLGTETIYYVLEGNTYEAQQNLQRFSQDIVLLQELLKSKGLPFSIKKVIEIVKDSDNLIKQKEFSQEILEKNDLITAPHRFNILYCLYDYGRMNWTDLKNKVQLTSGNLDYHLSVLQKKGWIIKDEEYQDRFLQFVDISEYGREEFAKYTEKISLMCQQVSFQTSN
ncbi:tetratricopeptide repeat protein [Candidatus Lokiarchaeum ossiferum]|uniref:tetratricopeptide repeat protein n=1 Tax=Candidatus Lokiarchaeum ossiferum TaxID=2951803 RepID=UPI00352EE1F1